MRYVVTGATGFIGGHLARQLVAAGHRVVAVVRVPVRAPAIVGVDWRPGDVTDKESMRAAVRDADGVFHVAGWYKIGVRDTSPALRVNVQGTRNVLELAREESVPRVVYTSTLAVFGDTHGRLVDESYRHGGPWLSVYDRSKWLAHYEVAEPMMKAGLPLVIVQPGLTYGPGDTSVVRDYLIQYLRKELRVLVNRTAYCWAHVEDTARGHLLAMERGTPGESYIIAGPPHTQVEAFQIAARITGIPAPWLRLPPFVVKGFAAVTGSESLRVTAGVTYLGDNAKARRVFGFDPRPLEAGLRETLEHEMRQRRAPRSA